MADPRDLAQRVKRTLGVLDLRVAFQPVLDLESGKIFAYEALARSSDPGFSPPKLFSDAITRGAVGELGRVIRRLALDGCPDHALFLNVHPREFDEGWIAMPEDPIFEHPLPVYLEITESVPMSFEDSSHAVLREIRSKGIRLAVDDLGAGYSNLKYIADLAPEVVKLDRELVLNLVNDNRVFRLVEAVTRLCVDLGAEVVAEGIESADELRAVRRAGVHYGQGYFIARPANPPPEVVAM
ncbi:MAG: EAL domain-containing protein [Deltaproteobacteria bacterium]|nr:EAL domain-containing protein [Deltaproteobacteria bacterium]